MVSNWIKNIIGLLFVFLFFVNSYAEIFKVPSRHPSVCNNGICINGTFMPGYQTDHFEAFLGLPFAKPPVGKLRFANPEPINFWTYNLDASLPREMCIQKTYIGPHSIAMGSEDCLYLNVYRPKYGQQSITSLPVLFYIHGGGLFSGAAVPSITGPEYFMDTSEVILVTAAYRLGPFGFLSTGDNIASGNFGFKDQVIAMKWVKENIKYFGGNPESVTIFGQSAGALSVHLHLMSTLSQKLFSNAALLSGSGIAPYAYINKNPLELAIEQAKFVDIINAENLTTKQLIEELRKIDALELVESQDKFKYFFSDPFVIYGPVIEETDCDESFLKENPLNIAKNGSYNYVPILFSTVPNEGAVRTANLLTDPNQIKMLNENYDSVLPKLLIINGRDSNDLQQKINKITKFYFNGTKHINELNGQRLTDMYTDRGFLVPLYNTIRSFTKRKNKRHNISIINFNFEGSTSYSEIFSGTKKNFGVVHCDDLLYLFRSPLLFPNDFPKNSKYAKLITNLVKTYIQFAKTGKPIKWSTTRSCSNNKLKTSFCEYQNILNNPNHDDIYVESTNAFDFDMLRLWMEIDEDQNLFF